MPFITLPCTKCGAALPITRGSMVQCFACGMKNVFVESFDELSRFVIDAFGYPKTIEEIEAQIDQKTIDERMLVIDKLFNQYLSQSRQLEYVILSKLDKTELPPDIGDLGKMIGKLGIVLDAYLIPHLTNDLQKQQYSEMSALCVIRNAMITALILTIEAKKTYKVEDAKRFYANALGNYQRVQEFAEKFAQLYPHMGFEDEKQLAKASEKFCKVITEMLTSSPSYFTDELEEIEAIIKDISDSRANTLKKQVLAFYHLGTAIQFIFDDIRKQEPFKGLAVITERVLFYTRELKENFALAKKWVLDIEDRFRQIQSQLMMLHCGQTLPYLDDYRKEFQLRYEELRQAYNNTLSRYVAITLSDFELELSESFELIESLIDDPSTPPEEIVVQFEKDRHELLVLAETVKSLLFDILKNAINEDLISTHSLEIVTSLSDKNATFDKKILKFINKLIEEFIDLRNTKRLRIEDQRSTFNITYFPIIERLMKSAFIIRLVDIPLPVFMELIILSTSMDVEKDYRIVLLIENPSPITLTNVGVSFFVPNSFRIKTRIMDVGKMRPGQKLSISTNVIPTIEGKFYLMAMLQYEHSKESFWTPTIKIPLIVGHPEKEEDLLKELYKKYGVDVNAVEYIKTLEANLKEFEEIKPINFEKSAADTLERDQADSLVRDLKDLEEDDKDNEKSNGNSPKKSSNSSEKTTKHSKGQDSKG